jgi:SAM-dependent methyltransferase
MKIIARYRGNLGDIAIWEDEADGTRFYLEGEIFQSHGSTKGHSQLDYVKIMEAFLRRADAVLVLGCGGGNLATMLGERGKEVTVVDFNPRSFQIAQEYFGMPKHLRCVVDDFRNYLLSESRCFDAIAIDVGGPGFNFEEQFDLPTCRSIRSRLQRGGRVIINVLVGCDFDAVADKIGHYLSADFSESWIMDHPGTVRRNALILCSVGISNAVIKRELDGLCDIGPVPWSARRPRRRSIDFPRTISLSHH